jgi:hypothetical protein
MLLRKNVWKTVGLFILISIPAGLLALPIAHIFGATHFISVSMACYFAAGSVLGGIFEYKFRSLNAKEFVYASAIYIVINIVLGVATHSKLIEQFVSFSESIVLVLGTYSPIRARFNQKALSLES